MKAPKPEEPKEILKSRFSANDILEQQSEIATNEAQHTDNHTIELGDNIDDNAKIPHAETTFHSMKREQLRKLLKKKNLSTGGTKEELVRRLINDTLHQQQVPISSEVLPQLRN